MKLVFTVVLLTCFLAYTSAEPQWFACPLFTDTTVDLTSNATVDKPVPDNALKSECTYLHLPLNYEESNGATVRIFVKRLLYKNMPAGKNNQIWFLAGGTGGDSSGIESTMYRLYSQIGNEFELYTSDHRGTGRSSRLSCDEIQAETIGSDGGIVITLDEYQKCVTSQVEYRKHFTITNAATDLVNIVQLFGVSYGTALGNRFFQLFTSTQTTINLAGIVLDSVLNTAGPQRTLIEQWASNIDVTAREFLTRCGNDTFCSSKLTTDPVQYTTKVLDSVFTNSSSCSAIAQVVERTKVVSILGDLMYMARDVVPAVIYRLGRCDPIIDVPALLHLLKYFASQSVGSCAPRFSNVLSQHLLISEMSQDNPNLEALEEFMAKKALVGGMVGINTVRTQIVTKWPTYATDKYFNQPIESTTQVPVLLLNGDLDIATPIGAAKAQLDNLKIANKRLISIPNAQHGALWTSPSLVAGGRENLTCGEQLFISFIQVGNVENVNTTCLERLEPLQLSWGNPLSGVLFGVSDLYEDAYGEPYETKQISFTVALGVCAGTLAAAIVISSSLYYLYYEKKLDKERRATLLH